jgi:peptidyl-prolyl cis-trans isomerase A (cyclophilin A)
MTMKPFRTAVAIVVLACLVRATPADAETINPVVRFTVFGNYSFDVELFANETPATVANFLGYMNGGSYTDSIIHRSTTSDPLDIQVIQGGSFYLGSNGLSVIETGAPIALEAGLPNLRGTLAMARTGDPDSATSGWFINVQNNPALDPSLDPFRDGYTVFGHVIPDVLPPLNPLSGMDLIDALATFAIYPQNLDVWTGSGFETVGFSQLPLLVQENQGYLVTITSIAPVPEPSAWTLAGGGLAAAAAWATRRHSRRRA